MSAKIETTVLGFNEFMSMEFVPPATFYIRDAIGQYVFIHTRSRAKAQAFVDEEYGKGKYKIIASKLQKNSGDLTCRGTATRKGQKAPN